MSWEYSSRKGNPYQKYFLALRAETQCCFISLTIKFPNDGHFGSKFSDPLTSYKENPIPIGALRAPDPTLAPILGGLYCIRNLLDNDTCPCGALWCTIVWNFFHTKNKKVLLRWLILIFFSGRNKKTHTSSPLNLIIFVQTYKARYLLPWSYKIYYPNDEI